MAHPEALAQQDVLTVTQAALERTHAPWLSVYLGFSATQVVFSEGMRPASAVLGRSTLSTLLTSTVNTLKGTLGVPLLLENLDYNATGAYEHICEPDFIRTVLEATDTYFLLDLSHAQVSASRLGFALDDYLAQLPLERVRQLHISGPRLVGETFADVHETLRPVDYQLLEQMLEQTSPWAVTLEYRRDAGALLKQVERLRNLLKQAAR